MKTIKDLTNKVISFRDARDWRQFHNPKDVAISLTLEAAELLDEELEEDFIESDALGSISSPISVAEDELDDLEEDI